MPGTRCGALFPTQPLSLPWPVAPWKPNGAQGTFWFPRVPRADPPSRRAAGRRPGCSRRVPVPAARSSFSVLLPWLLLRRGRGPVGRQRLRSASGWEARRGRVPAPRCFLKTGTGRQRHRQRAAVLVGSAGRAAPWSHRREVRGDPPGRGCGWGRRPRALPGRTGRSAPEPRGGGSAAAGAVLRVKPLLRVRKLLCEGGSAPAQHRGAAGGGRAGQVRAGGPRPSVAALWFAGAFRRDVPKSPVRHLRADLNKRSILGLRYQRSESAY